MSKRVTKVYENERHRAAIQWSDTAIYGFVVKPTEHERCLIDAVNSLPLICRKTVILVAFERIPMEQIATALRMSRMTVRFLVYRGGLLIREYLTDHGRQTTPDVILNRIFANWPYREYAQLVRLRKNIMFLKWPHSEL